MRISQRRPRETNQESTPRSSGQPLDTSLRAYFEPLLGHDFSQVRIHTDARGPAVFGAAAYTVDNDLTFGPGWYQPDTAHGRHLLAHELTHVVQQQNAPSTSTARVASRYDASEQEAEAVARPLTMGRPVSVHESAAVHVAPGLIDWIEDTASDVGSFVGDAASSAWDVTKDIGGDIYSGMKSAAGGVRSATNWAVNGIDWLEDEASSGAHWLADKAEGIPVLEQLASGGAWMVDESTQLTGGLLKGATSLAGGVLSMAADPVDTAIGLEKMAEHVSIPGVPNPFKAMHGLYDVAVNDESWGDFADKTFNPLTSMKDDARFFGQMGSALIDPYRESIAKGKYADAAGRGIFDVLAMIGTGGESAAAEAGVEGVAAMSRLGEVGELAKGSEVLEGANLASDAGKATEALEAANAGGQSSHVTELLEGGAGGGGGSVASDMAAAKPPGKQYLDPWPKDLGPEPPLAPHQVRMELPSSGLTPGTEEAIAEGLKGPGVTKPGPNVPGSVEDVSFGDIAEGTAPPPSAPIPAESLKGSSLRELGERPPDLDLGGIADDASSLLENGEMPFQTEGPVLRMPLRNEPPSMLEVGAGPRDVNSGWPVSIQEDPVGGMLNRVRTDVNVRPGVEYLDATQPLPEMLGGQPAAGAFDTVLVNNPRGYNPNLTELSTALNEDGRIISQGTGRLTPTASVGEMPPELLEAPFGPGGRGGNPNYQQMLEGEAHAGLEKVGMEELGGELMPQGLLPPPFMPGRGPMTQVPPDIIGREFWRTAGDAPVIPNSRLVYRRR